MGAFDGASASGSAGIGMAALAGGPAGLISAGAGLISGFFSSRAQAKQQKKQNRFQFQSEKYFRDLDRKRQLEDRRYAEEAIGGYRDYAPGRPLMAPAYTDPNTVVLKNPKFG